MTTEKDYYELLEVAKTASGDEIKKSYHRLAMKYHPDRNPGDKDAEAKFKEINEAYDVLKDEQKRAAYDRYGHQAFANGGMGGGNPFNGFDFNFGGGFSDIFSDVFSEFMGGGRQNSKKAAYAQDGADIRYNLEITLEEAFTGVEKEIKIPSTKECETCHGHGTADGKEAPACPYCHGSGKIRTQHGFMLVETYCPHCHGEGRLVKDVCKTCHGEGIIHNEKVLKIKIPAGVEDNTRMRVPNEGQSGIRGGENGDLYVFISVKEHKLFIRDGASLFVRVPISMTCAALGGKIEIPGIDGEKIEIDVASGTQNDQQKKVNGKGMSVIRSSRRGDLFVKFRVETPTNLTVRQKELLEEFREISKDENCQPEAKSFFDKIKDLFVA